MQAIHRRGRTRTGSWRRLWLGLGAAVALAGAMPAAASWTRIDAGTSVDLYGVDAVDATTAYVVGERGTILKTTDGGASWTKLRTGWRTAVIGLQFLDANNGYVLSGGLRRTRDGGISWQLLTVPPNDGISSMYFLNAELGYLGSRGTLLKTSDGGLTWSTLRVGDFDIQAIQFDASGTIGYVAGTDWGSGYVAKTVDGGATWTYSLWIDGGNVHDLHFPVDSSLGYLANENMYGGAPGIYKTTDGGATWSLTGVGPATESVGRLHFADALNGVALGYRGSLFHTTDGGATWTEGWLGVETMLYGFDISGSTGYIAGSDGFLARTTDGGAPSIRAAFLHPVAAGSVNGFAQYIGCYAPYDCVNDQPANAAAGAPLAPDSRDYLVDSAGNRAMFALGDGLIPAGHRVVGVRVYLAATQQTGPMASLGYQRLGIDAAPVDSPYFWVANYWVSGWASWGWSGLNWSPADVDALEIGVKSYAGDWLEAGQLFIRIYYEPLP